MIKLAHVMGIKGDDKRYIRRVWAETGTDGAIIAETKNSIIADCYEGFKFFVFWNEDEVNKFLND